MSVALLLLLKLAVAVHCQSTISHGTDATCENERYDDLKSEMESIRQQLLLMSMQQEKKSDIEEIRKILNQQQIQPRNGECRKNCPPGFEYLSEVGSCYRLISELITWDAATERCRQVMPGVHLAAITTKTENDAVVRFLQSHFRGGNTNCRPPGTRWPHLQDLIWIGGQTINPRQCGTGFVWRPLRGIEIPFNYTNWYSAYPDCYESKEHCVHYVSGRNYLWNDFNCNLLSCAICELHV